MCAHMRVHTHPYGSHVKARGQLGEVGSVLPSSWFWGWNPGLPASATSLVPAASAHCF